MSFNSIKHKLSKACVFDLEDILSFEKQVLNDSSEYTSKRSLKRLIKSANSEFLLIKNQSLAGLIEYNQRPLTCLNAPFLVLFGF